MIVKAESMEYPDFGFEKKMTKKDNSNTLICRYTGGLCPKLKKPVTFLFYLPLRNAYL